MSDAEMVPVLPCDREAANAFFRRADCPVSVKMTLGYDPTPLVQILAAHRLAAEAAAIERCAGWHDQQGRQYRAWAAESNAPDSVISKHTERAKSHDLHATAIRALKGGAEIREQEDWKQACRDMTTLAADERDRNIVLIGLLEHARWYVVKAMDAHENTDSRYLLNEIEEALKLPSAIRPIKEGASHEK